jgi:membrane-associated HD superfamily phosphohydrolase
VLAQRAESLVRFSRRDATRLGVASAVLVLVLTTILGVDVLMPQPLSLNVGDVATRDIVSPVTPVPFDSDVQTQARRDEAAKDVPPQYDYSTEKAIAVAAEQVTALRRAIVPINTAFDPATKKTDREGLLADALPALSSAARATLEALTPARWTAVREEAIRILDATERTELKDAAVAQTRLTLESRMAGGFSPGSSSRRSWSPTRPSAPTPPRPRSSASPHRSRRSPSRSARAR